MAHDTSPQCKEQSSRTLPGFRREVCILPVVDQKRGTLGKSCIVLELSSYTDGFGQTKRSVCWSPPFPTEDAALDFASRLGEPGATIEFDPSAGQEDHEQ